MFPATSNTELATHDIVRTSSPFTLPFTGIPRSTDVPDTDILLGVADDKLAVPPWIVKLKSDSCKLDVLVSDP